jgi:hypothetical protein
MISNHTQDRPQKKSRQQYHNNNIVLSQSTSGYQENRKELSQNFASNQEPFWLYSNSDLRVDTNKRFNFTPPHTKKN